MILVHWVNATNQSHSDIGSASFGQIHNMKMLLKLFLFCVILAAYVIAGLIPGNGAAVLTRPVAVEESEPRYEFQYVIHDAYTGDIKDQFEHRRGDYVTGRYSLIEPDGHRRIVDYNSDPLLGFTAEVRRELPVVRSYHAITKPHIAAVAAETAESWPA